MIKRLIIALTLIAAFIPYGTALAIDDPDSLPEINAVYVYEDTYQDGDIGVLIDYTIEYAVNPDENANQAYMAVFIDSDGVTQLKATAPYVFDDDGYGRGLIWIRFTPAEVIAYGITSADILLYKIWLTGNPTLAWIGDPPKTEVGIDYWMPAGASAETLLGLRVLYYADILELAWAEDLIQTTPLGNRLTDTGAEYFENAITYLRDISPHVFAAGETSPTIEDIDYTVTYEAIAESGTGTVAGSPFAITEGGDTVTVNPVGTIVITLAKGVSGTITDDTGTVTGSPVTLVAGENTLTVTGAGDFTVDVSAVTTGSGLVGTVIGTPFDLTAIAAVFGMPVTLFSGFVWFLITLLICVALYNRVSGKTSQMLGQTNPASKVVMIVFDICIIGGGVLGMLPLLATIILFIASCALTGFVLFFRGSSI